MKRAILVLLGLALGACGSAESARPAAAARLADPSVWDRPAAGRYVVRDVELTVEGLPEGVDASIVGTQPAVVDADGGVGAASGATSRRDLRACVTSDVTFREGSARVEVPVGGEVRVLGGEGDRVRVAPPFETWPGQGQVLPRSQLNGVCASSAAPVEGDRTVPYRDAFERACLFAGRPREGTPAHVVLPHGTQVQVLRSTQGWLEARAVVNGATVTGWLHERTLVESERRTDLAAMKLLEATTIGPFELEVGLPVLTGDMLCLEGPCQGDRVRRFQLIVETERGRVRLRGPASRLALVADLGGRAFVEVDEGTGACWYPDAPAIRSVRGTLSRSAIRRVIRGHTGEVRDCYERRLDVRPRLTGRLMSSFLIGPSGRVTEVRTTPFDPYVAECTRIAILGMRFPAPDGGFVGVNYPFVFTRGD